MLVVLTIMESVQSVIADPAAFSVDNSVSYWLIKLVM